MRKLLNTWLNRPAALSGVLLLLATTLALVLANSEFRESYARWFEVQFSVGLDGFSLTKPLILWINDLLMAIFFLLVGLEIKREVLAGALSTVKQAVLPVAAALGGVLVPALIYSAINQTQGGDPSGWAIPAATDIAFALGILALFGDRVPLSMKVFLTTVAVFDDLIAVLIIALFFTSSVSLGALIGAGATLGALFGINALGIRRSLPYALLGIVLWVFVLKSGLHATLAGVLLAASIPIRPIAELDLTSELAAVVKQAEREDSDGLAPDTIIHRVRSLCDSVESPVVRWEHAVQPLVLFFIVPVFAFANSGVSLSDGEGSGLGPVGFGVAAGLVVGKPLGVTLFSWLALRSGFASLPEGLDFLRLHAASWLAGIGFTMSLFISGLALEGAALSAARSGLLIGSGVAALFGATLVFWTCVRTPRREAHTSRGGPLPTPSN